MKTLFLLSLLVLLSGCHRKEQTEKYQLRDNMGRILSDDDMKYSIPCDTGITNDASVRTTRYQFARLLLNNNIGQFTGNFEAHGDTVEITHFRCERAW
jgi:hypothetical protein